VLAFGSALTGDLAGFERDMATNYVGTLRVTRAFQPALERNAPAAIVNILTLIALAPAGPMAGYSASKAAAHSFTQALRAELRDRGITVLGAYPGGIDTDMLAGVDAPKAPPEVVAERVIAGLAAGETLVFPDDNSPAPDRSTCPTRSSSSRCWPADPAAPRSHPYGRTTFQEQQ